MKKTVLTLAVACLLMANSAKADQKSNHPLSSYPQISIDFEVSSFCKAIMQGDIETVKRMIDLGEDVNKKSLGMTPAIFAARYNKAEILKILIENGADLSIRSDKGYTIKKHAELSNAQDALAILEAVM
ncbi:ankyrin repeat domain-containing protein [Maribacter halichondriae]|uniref:ankyrin repeat domain-containing protein n=1 Tax=Maribacter halichondriae TaxID=2980554 RepID=UPI002358DDF9|nr:ankyrin repeat domain-containing protein [Maribacter sp. Hal144]